MIYEHKLVQSKDDDLDDVLELYSKSGWELITVVAAGSTMFNLFFKRAMLIADYAPLERRISGDKVPQTVEEAYSPEGDPLNAWIFGLFERLVNVGLEGIGYVGEREAEARKKVCDVYEEVRAEALKRLTTEKK